MMSLALHSAVLVVLISVVYADTIAPPPTAVTPEYPRVSAPEIRPIPTAQPFVGQVTVYVTSNSPQCTIFFTKDESVPNNSTSKIYTEPLLFFTPGTYTVKAIASPNTPFRSDSVVAVQTYVVEAGPVLPPNPSPPPGKYRNNVTVTLTELDRGAQVAYVVDVPNPGRLWIPYKQPIVLDRPGEHIIQAQAVLGTKTSPIAKFMYVISEQLVFDITTECKECEGVPTVGETFTIFLQNPPSPEFFIFLTTSIQGCDRVNHVLDDTKMLRKSHPMRSATFRSYGEDSVPVYVCVGAKEAGPFELVPPRVQKETRGFKMAKARHPYRRLRAPQFGPQPGQYVQAPQSRDGGLSMLWWVLSFALIGAVAINFFKGKKQHAPVATRDTEMR